MTLCAEQRILLLPVGARLAGLEDRLVDPFDEGLVLEVRAGAFGESAVDVAFLAALFGNRRDAGEALGALGCREARAVVAEGGGQACSEVRAGAGQRLEELGVVELLAPYDDDASLSRTEAADMG